MAEPYELKRLNMIIYPYLLSNLYFIVYLIFFLFINLDIMKMHSLSRNRSLVNRI